MELYEAMRTTFACRDFTDDPLPDEVIYEMIENARFSPSGGNRQGNRVIIVRDMATRAAALRPDGAGRQALSRPDGRRREPLERLHSDQAHA